MPILAISGQTLRVTRQALDAAGIPCIAGGGASSNFNDYKFIDNTGLEWEVQAFSGWDSSGKGIFDLKVPTISIPESRTMTRTYKGEAFSFNPNPLELSLVPPYQGYFDLTDALVASDCTPILSNLSYLPDYSGNGRDLGKLAGGNLSYPFQSTSQYVTSINGSLITLGRNCVGMNSDSDDVKLGILESSHRNELCCGGERPPKVSVIECIFNRYINDTRYNNNFPMLRFAYKLNINDKTRTIGVYLEGQSYHKIYLVQGGDNPVEGNWNGGITTDAPLNVFYQRYQIIHVAIRLEWADWDSSTTSGVPTISLYINGIKRITYTLSRQLTSDVTWTNSDPLGFYFMFRKYTSGSYHLALAMLDCAAYPSTHTDEQILNNAKAWGLA